MEQVNEETRKLKRLYRNRIAAQQAREKKKLQETQLEIQATQLRNQVIQLVQEKIKLQNDNNALRRIIIGMNQGQEVSQNEMEIDVNQFYMQSVDNADITLNQVTEDSSSDFNNKQQIDQLQFTEDKNQILDTRIQETSKNIQIVQDDKLSQSFLVQSGQKQLGMEKLGKTSTRKDAQHLLHGQGQGQGLETQEQIIAPNVNNVQGNDFKKTCGQNVDLTLDQGCKTYQKDEQLQLCECDNLVGFEGPMQSGQFTSEVIDDALDDFLVPVSADDILNGPYDVKATSPQQYNDMMDMLAGQ